MCDFDSDEVKTYSGRAGCDMPDKICPRCGKPLKKMGFDIPFETFLGFKGNKEPDIDLNFSGEYQSKAHKYTEVIFGAGQTFRAGTIGTLADKTAFGYVKNYYEERGVHKRNCEIDRIVQGCVRCPAYHRTASGRYRRSSSWRGDQFLYSGTASGQRCDIPTLSPPILITILSTITC